eukprot:7474362-Pyramimonas_sp.AAC.1
MYHHVVRELDGLLLDLLGELARRCHNQRVRPLRLVGLVQRGLLADVRQHRHHERARLARPCRLAPGFLIIRG